MYVAHHDLEFRYMVLSLVKKNNIYINVTDDPFCNIQAKGLI